MILNAWTVAVLFLAGTAVLLALAVLAVTARAARRAAGRGPSGLEDAGHLLSLLIGVLLVTRLVAWPAFYALLASYVPELEASGAMCAYGVVATSPGAGLGAQAAKVAALFALGGWFVLARADRLDPRAPFLGPRVGLAAAAAVLVLADAGLETAFLLAPREAAEVTCCSAFLDTRTDDPSLGGGAAARASTLARDLALFAAVHAAAIAFALRARPRGPGRRVRISLGAALLGLGVLAVSVHAWVASFAPRVLQLPYHHCPYEVLTGHPVMALAALATLAGAGALLWASVFELLRARAPGAGERVQRALLGAAALALATGAVLVAAHVL